MKLLCAVGLSALMLVPASQVTAEESKNSNIKPLAEIQLDPGSCHIVFGVIVCTLQIAQGTIILNIDPKHIQSLQGMIK